MDNPPLNSFRKNSIINQKIPSNKALQKRIHELFLKKYSKLPFSYNKNIIENIIYNERSHIVATFKDHLIADDIGEFLKRYYTKKEIDERLKKYYEYYDLYSKVFPNYTVFIEGKYLYQNIQKKQKMIDLQEKMELEQLKKNKEKEDMSSSYSESKESVLNSDVIDSILNGTNTEGIKILFDIQESDINDEENLNKDINNIIDEINKFIPKEKKIINNHNIIKNKIIKINNFNNNFIQNNSINKNRNEVNNNGNGNIRIKNISVPMNLNNTKNKILSYSNMNPTMNNANITYYRDMRSIISKYFNYPTYQRNIFLNLNGKNIKNVNKIQAKSNEKNLVEKLEHNLSKMKQKSIFYNKNSFQNISTTNQTQKDISLSKMNSNIYTKKPSTSNSLNHNQKIVRENLNHFNFYNVHNNSIIQNIERRNKEISPLTSRNPKTKRSEQNTGRIQSAKNIKGNTYRHISETISRNKYTNNLKLQNKSKSTIMNSTYYIKIAQCKENLKTKYIQKNVLNNTKDKYQRAISKIDNHKQKKYINNHNSRNRNDIKGKILYNDNNSRNYNIKFVSKNLSQMKTFLNKKKTEFNNNFSMKSGITDKTDIKRNFVIGFNIKNLSKVLNMSNINPKETFYKSHRNNLLIVNN